VDSSAGPPGRVLEDRRPAERIDVLAALQIDLDLRHEPLSVDLAGERPLPLSRSLGSTADTIQHVRKRQMKEAAVAWALDEVEAQLREEPAHLLTGEDIRSWLLTAPNEIGVYVEAARVEGSKATTVQFDLPAGATGLLPGHARTERKLLLPLDGHAAREPELLHLVFETAGRVYAFEGLEDAGDSPQPSGRRDGDRPRRWYRSVHAGRGPALRAGGGRGCLRGHADPPAR